MFSFKRWMPVTGRVAASGAAHSSRFDRASRRGVWLPALLVVVALAACSDSSSRTIPAAYDPGTEYDPGITAADLSIGEGNSYFPLVVGATWAYDAETEDGSEHTDVKVTSATKQVNGVQAVVVRDTVYLDGELIEDTRDWYAQDAAGNVWYLGEDTAEYENGVVVSTEGAWEWGVGGALPGIAMLADPQVGDFYRQEYDAGNAEDLGRIVSVGETVELQSGTFTGCIQTNDTTDLDPSVDEYKFYCPGIGVVKEVEGETQVELTEYSGL